MDKVWVEGLRCWAHVGVPAAERARRQQVILELEIELDLERAGRLDQVKDTVDYALVCAQVKHLVQSRRFHLVEAMAHCVARLILDQFHPDAVRVRIRKFSVPGAASVGVELTRDKSRTRKGSTRAAPGSPGSAASWPGHR